jgi:hypothetical protein
MVEVLMVEVLIKEKQILDSGLINSAAYFTRKGNSRI